MARYTLDTRLVCTVARTAAMIQAPDAVTLSFMPAENTDADSARTLATMLMAHVKDGFDLSKSGIALDVTDERPGDYLTVRARASDGLASDALLNHVERLFEMAMQRAADEGTITTCDRETVE